MKKIIAQFILLFFTVLAGFGIYFIVLGIRGSEDKIEGSVYIQKKYGFQLTIPSGWYPELPKDKGIGRLYVKKYGSAPPSLSNPGAYLPLVAVNYLETDAGAKNPIRRQMDLILSDIKSEPQLYQGFNLITEQVSSGRNFDSVGTLAYSFRGVLGRFQRTEIRYYLRRNFLIWFMLADIERVFNNKILDQLASGLRFG